MSVSARVYAGSCVCMCVYIDAGIRIRVRVCVCVCVCTSVSLLVSWHTGWLALWYINPFMSKCDFKITVHRHIRYKNLSSKSF